MTKSESQVVSGTVRDLLLCCPVHHTCTKLTSVGLASPTSALLDPCFNYCLVLSASCRQVVNLFKSHTVDISGAQAAQQLTRLV